MIKPYIEFSNFDVFAIIKELELVLQNGIILNIYEIEDLLIIKVNTESGKKNLIIQKDSRINLTEYNYPIPSYPNQFIISLRKFLKNRKILKIFQHQFDRIVIFELSDIGDKSWKFVIELFNKGNFLLLDEKNNIKIAKKYKKFKNREILPNKEYLFPISQEYNFLTIKKEEFIDIFESSNAEIVRDLSRNIHISGLYSEEICYRANIDKNLLGINLSDDQYDKLFASFKSLRNQLLFGEINAQIVFDRMDNQISVLPFNLEIFKDYKKSNFNSFNDAVDVFYSKIFSETLSNPKDQKIDDQIKAQKKIKENQQNYIEHLKHKKENSYKIGDSIYANLNSLEKLRMVILDARKKHYDWEIINDKLNKAKMENLEGTEFFEKLIPSTNHLLIKIDFNDVYLDLKKTIAENANIIYNKGKKAERKLKGTILALEKTQEKIRKLKLEKESIEKEINFLIRKPRKKWYEKYRWFISSDGFLIIGGRDASSNEVIFKKHIDQNDLIFHTNFPGSPLVVIKNPKNQTIHANTIQEAADFTASYSRAWKENWGLVDVFSITPDQISKTPPSGEFLPKGSFIISGKKNFIKNSKTELTIGLEIIEMKRETQENHKILFPKIICGPESAIKLQTNNYLTIIPSKSRGLTKGILAKEIKSYFIRNIETEKKKWIKLLSLDTILLYLPSGKSTIKSKD
jgi:predicted ribosome quality control (RQC) complex YloA/Tae2 family protein